MHIHQYIRKYLRQNNNKHFIGILIIVVLGLLILVAEGSGLHLGGTHASTPAPCTNSNEPFSGQPICIPNHGSTTSTNPYSIQPHHTPAPQAHTSHAPGGSFEDIARQAATQASINPDLFIRQIRQESGFNPDAISPAGAIGIAQFLPGTAASLGVNPNDPVQSLYGAARLMASLSALYKGNYAMALAAYNAGPGNVQNAINMGGSNWQAYLPAETQNYVAAILG